MSGGLEENVEDAYIISVPKTADYSPQERRNAYAGMLQMAEQLHQEQAEKFIVIIRYQFVAAIAATIKNEGIVELLKSNGYSVEKQAKIQKLQS